MMAAFDAYGHGAARVVSCPLAARAVARRSRQFEATTLGINHFTRLLKSLQLATKQPPPPGYILVHSQVRSTPGKFRRNLGFRAWWTKPGKEFVPCDCGWRSDLGKHFRVERAGPVIERRGRRQAESAT
jgi:hypothetical protein